jgi:hypothetical protein
MKTNIFSILLGFIVFFISNKTYSQSAYSYPREYGGYIEPYNSGLAERVMYEKQKKYNYNRAIVQKQVNNLYEILNILKILNNGL